MMRLILISLQVCLIGIVYTAMAGAMGGLSGGGIGGGGPVAMAGMLFWLFSLVATGIVFATLILPFLITLSITLFCAITAGYRFLRWTRWIGIGANSIAALYFMFFMDVEKVPHWGTAQWGIVAFFLLNIVLLYALPKRPDVIRSRRIIVRAHLGLLAGVAILLAAAVFWMQENPRGSANTIPLLPILLFFAVYSLPFLLNYSVSRTITLQGDSKRILVPLSVSVLVVGLILLLLPVFILPVGLSLLFLLGLLEMLLLYPSEAPVRNSPRYFLVMLLGRLPDKEPGAQA